MVTRIHLSSMAGYQNRYQTDFRLFRRFPNQERSFCGLCEWIAPLSWIRNMSSAKLFKPDTVIANAVGSDWHYGSYLAYSRTGHIPSSVNAPYPDYFQKDKTWKPESELRRLFESLGMLREKEIIAYCGGNPAASLALFHAPLCTGLP